MDVLWEVITRHCEVLRLPTTWLASSCTWSLGGTHASTNKTPFHTSHLFLWEQSCNALWEHRRDFGGAGLLMTIFNLTWFSSCTACFYLHMFTETLFEWFLWNKRSYSQPLWFSFEMWERDRFIQSGAAIGVVACIITKLEQSLQVCSLKQ